MEADRIMRRDPKTGHITEYLLPRQTSPGLVEFTVQPGAGL
jgi:hypothetical protein